MKKILRSITPIFIKKMYRDLFYKAPVHGWFGNYGTWTEAQSRSTGYDAANILNTVKAAVLKVKNGEAPYERDSVVFEKVECTVPLLNAFKKIALEGNGVLHVIDFGGSLGSSYFQNRSFLQDLKELKWNVVEQKHFVDCGKECIEGEQLKFYYTIEEAINDSGKQVLLLSSVIQYFEKPYELIEKCLAFDFDYIIIDRTAFVKSQPERITVQIVPESIYKASYPAWFLNEEKFVGSFKKQYEIVDAFISDLSKPMNIDNKTEVYWKGFILKKKQ